MTTSADALLAALPVTFRFTDAVKVIGERQLRNLVAEGRVTAFARGLYRITDWLVDENLVEIASRTSTATLCLRTALARADLIDDIPQSVDVAIPRGIWRSKTTVPVRWPHFDSATFNIGRECLDIGSDLTIGVYSPERSIVDAFRLRHLQGPDMAIEALKRWLRDGGQPSTLLRIAKSFPAGLPALRHAMEVLL